MSKKSSVPKAQNAPQQRLPVTTPIVANSEPERTNWWGPRGCYNEPDSGFPDIDGFVINLQDAKKHADPQYYYRDVEDGTFLCYCKWFSDKKLADYLAAKEAKQQQQPPIQSPLPPPQKTAPNWQNKNQNFKAAPPVMATKIENSPPALPGYHKTVIDITKEKSPKPQQATFGTTPNELRFAIDNMSNASKMMVDNMTKFEKRMGVYNTLAESQMTVIYQLRETIKVLNTSVNLLNASITDLTEHLDGKKTSEEPAHKKQRVLQQEDEDAQIPDTDIELQHQVEEEETEEKN